MTADWKKKPLERATRREDFKALQEKVKLLEHRLKESNKVKKFYADRAEKLAGALMSAREAANRYDALRMKGVLIDIDGEFKFLKGEDLDEFWDERDKRQGNRILNESMMAQMMANVISTPFNPVSEGTVTGWVKDGEARWTKFEVVYGSDS